MSDVGATYFGPGSFDAASSQVALRKGFTDDMRPAPDTLPQFLGLSEDGYAVFDHGELRKGIEGDKIVMSLEEVKTVLSRAGFVGDILGKAYKDDMVREFTNARYALAMGLAKPTFPAVKEKIATGVAVNFD